jgi:acetyl-CoA synthetase
VLRGEWYLTGDLGAARRRRLLLVRRARRRRDQVGGHLIGPFEVESALMEHPAVAEAGVIGKPDPVAGEVVKAFVSLKAARRERALRWSCWARPQALGAAVAPKEIAFLPAAAHPQRQDHAPPAEGARTRPARGRHLDPRGHAPRRDDRTPT